MFSRWLERFATLIGTWLLTTAAIYAFFRIFAKTPNIFPQILPNDPSPTTLDLLFIVTGIIGGLLALCFVGLFLAKISVRTARALRKRQPESRQ